MRSSSGRFGETGFRSWLWALVVPLLLAGCTSWQQTRTDVVNPIHALLHHEYAEALAELKPEALASLFAEADRAANMAPSLELLSRFASIEQVRVAIDTVNLEQVPAPAEIDIVVEGARPNGELLTVMQHKQLALVREAGGWKISGDLPQPLREVPVPSATYADEAKLRGLWFRHETRMVPDPHGTPQRFIYGSGVAVADVNGDDWADVILLAGDRIELFLNRKGDFSRASKDWGLGQSLDRVLTIALTADFDNDGRSDLFVGAEGGQSILFRNHGNGFAPVENSGIVTTERTISATAADFDGDGWVDLFLANHEDVYWNAPDPPGSATNAQPDQLFLNNGDGSFRDVTREAGVANRGWSLAPVAADYDLDGDVDLFVGNDFGLDSLYRNDGSAHFEEVSSAAGVDLPVASMSADWGDYDGDGDLDLFVAGMRSGSGWVLEVPEFRVARVPRLLDMMFRPYVRKAIRAWFLGNRFYQNNGDGTFAEIALESGARDSGWGWGSVWLDFDNDGRLDLYSSNGFISGPSEADV